MSTYRVHNLVIGFMLFLLSTVGVASVQSFESVQRHGGRNGWDLFVDYRNTRLVSGWEGGNDIVLADAVRRVHSETDLLVGFDGSFSDQSGTYRVVNRGARIVSKPVRFGSGSAAFDGKGELAFLPESEALFLPDSQPGSFTIDFWLHPVHVTEGAMILRWRGALLNGDKPVLQDLRLEISDRRLQWVLSNLVVSSVNGRIETAEPVILTARRSLIPRNWQHHQLRYDSAIGQLSYQVNGVPEVIRYLSDTGLEDGTHHAILFGSDTGDGLVLGNGFRGALDELRISRTTAGGPQPSRYTGEPGQVVSHPIDLGGSGARLLSVGTRAHEPGATEVRGYYRFSDVVVSNDVRNALDADWNPIPRDGAIQGNARGRFLQLRYDLLADAARVESPRLQEIRIRYMEAVPPPPPRVVTGRSVPGGVELAWDRVLEGSVIGYRVYFGERPRRYTGVGNLISPRDVGAATTITITGLDEDVPYVFAVESYDRYGQAGPLSREVEVRSGREGEAR